MYKLVLCFVICVAALSAGNILTNPGFETVAIGAPQYAIFGTGNTTGLPGWEVTGSNCGPNCALLLTNSYVESELNGLGFTSHGGNQNLDITASGNTEDGGIQQLVNLTPGVAYTLSFWLGNQDNAAPSYSLTSIVDVLINGTLLQSFSNNTNSSHNVNWQQQSLTFVASTASNTIQFRNATAFNDKYAGLDDVYLDVANANGAVPEPATMGLTAAAVAALFLRSRRRA